MKFDRFAKEYSKMQITSIEETDKIHAIIMCKNSIDIQKHIDEFKKRNPKGKIEDLMKYLFSKFPYLPIICDKRATFFEPVVVDEDEQEQEVEDENATTAS